MRIKHRLPVLPAKSAEVSAEYQAEVDRATSAAERRFRVAQQRLESAERRRDRLQAQRVTAARARQHKRDLATALALVELRRAELEELARMMQSSPASAVHRGDRSYRPVPAGNGTLL
jgi:hypothetical protein